MFLFHEKWLLYRQLLLLIQNDWAIYSFNKKIVSSDLCCPCRLCYCLCLMGPDGFARILSFSHFFFLGFMIMFYPVRFVFGVCDAARDLTDIDR